MLNARRRCACRPYGFCGHRLDRRPDKAKPPSGIKTGPALMLNARRRCACRAYGFRGHRLNRRPDKAKPPSGILSDTRPYRAA